MSIYYFNKNTDKNNNHEVHTSDCSYLPLPENKKLIGDFDNCEKAIEKAKKDTDSDNFDGCYHCCKTCHKG